MHAAPSTQHYFVDDSAKNVRQAIEMGWHHAVHFDEAMSHGPCTRDGIVTISTLQELVQVWPDVFL